MSIQTKINDSQNAYKFWRVWRKNDVEAPRQKRGNSKNAYNYCRFWRILMITRVEERWRSSKMWILARTCTKNEPPMDPSKHEAISIWHFGGGHSNILKSAESRMWTAPQTCDKNEGRQREAKPIYPNELVRFTARTPCWQATVWGINSRNPYFCNADRTLGCHGLSMGSPKPL